jgi:hypothetical protein
MNRSSDWQTFASGSIALFPPEEYLLEEEEQRSCAREKVSLQAAEAGAEQEANPEHLGQTYRLPLHV